MRGVLMVVPMARHERNLVAGNGADHDRSGRWPKGCLDDDLSRVVEELVEARTAEHTNSYVQSGDEGNRTPDIYLAKVALCQLSYVPVLAAATLSADSHLAAFAEFAELSR